MTRITGSENSGSDNPSESAPACVHKKPANGMTSSDGTGTIVLSSTISRNRPG